VTGKHFGIAATIAAVALLVTGCGGGAAGTPAARGGGGVGGLSQSLGATSGSLVLPLNAYSPSDGELASLDNDIRVVASRCIRKDGFSYRAVVIPAVSLGGDPGRGEFYDFGVTSMAFASVHGYQDDVPVYPREPGGLSKASAEGAAYVKCLVAARRESGYAGIAPYLMFYQTVGISAWQKTLASPVVVAGFKRWSACMAAKGYDYANPSQSMLGEPGNSQVPTQWHVASPAGPSQREIQVAVTDVRCKESTGLLRQWIRVTAESQALLVQKYLPQLRAGYAAFKKVLVRVQEMAAGA
jgi:hypothetical protein